MTKDIYTFIASKMTVDSSNNCCLTGIVNGANINTRDNIYLLGPRGHIINTHIDELKDLNNKTISIAKNNDEVILVLSHLHPSQVYKCDVITNKKPSLEIKNDNNLENIRLSALLKEKNRVHDHELINLVFDDIIMTAHFLTATTEKVGNNLNKDIEFNILPIETSEKKYYIPAFTDKSEFEKNDFFKNQNMKIMNFDNFADIILNSDTFSGFVVNPFGEQVKLTRETIKTLENQKKNIMHKTSNENLNLEDNFQVTDIEDYPEDMIYEIEKYMLYNKNINKAWLRLLKRDNEESYLLIIDTEKDYDLICEDISKISTPFLTKLPLDMISYKENYENQGFGKIAVKNSKPFFTK